MIVETATSLVQDALRRIESQGTRRLLDQGPDGRPLLQLREAITARVFDGRPRHVDRLRAALTAASGAADVLDAARQALAVEQKRGEIVGFLDWAARAQPRHICEIGTHNGGTHLLFKHAFKSAQLTIGVDLFVRHKRHLELLAPSGQSTVLLDGSSYAEATVAQVETALGGRWLDLLFIDGDHSFEGASADFEHYRHLVRPGGIIAFHDIVVDEYTRSGRRTGAWVGEVPKLWQQLKAQYAEHREFVDSWQQDGYGIGAFVYDPAVQPRLAG